MEWGCEKELKDTCVRVVSLCMPLIPVNFALNWLDFPFSRAYSESLSLGPIINFLLKLWL